MAPQKGGFTYVDGGVYDNYPIDIFDNKKYVSPENSLPIPKNVDPDAVYNKEILGLRVDKSMIGHFQEITDIEQYALVMLGGLLDNLNKIHLEQNDWHRTIYIDTFNVSATDFNLDQATLQKLIQSGQQGAANYLKWFDNPAPGEEKPINK